MSGYTRQSAAEMVTDAVIYASSLNNEFNTLQAAFDGSTGHTHDGLTGNGPKINLATSIIGILPAANGGLGGINKTDATAAPTVSDDANDGYVVGSLWVDVTNDIVYICADSTPGIAVWNRYQPFDAGLTSIAGLTTAADRMIYTTALDVYAVTPLTSFARSILDDSDASTVLSTLGFSSYGKTLINGADAAATRTTLGLGSISTQNSNNITITGGTISNITITGGTISNITDLAIDDGGTGASTASGARTNLGLVIGTNVQAYDAGLQSIAGLTTSSDQMIYTTGSDTYATTSVTSFARTILDDTDAATVRSTIGAQQSDTELTALAGLTSAANKLPYFTGSGTAGLADFTAAGRALVDDPHAAAQRTTLDVYSTSEVDALTTIATKAQAEEGTNNTQIMTPLRTWEQGVARDARFLHVRDQKAIGVSAANSTTTWSTREFNTVILNGIAGASLSSNAITLPQGTYEATVTAPARGTSYSKLRLRNTTDAVTVIEGPQGYNNNSSPNSTIASLQLSGRFTITSPKTFEVQQISTSVITGGHGLAASLGAAEIYAEMFIRKVD